MPETHAAVVPYLREAHTLELALIRTLQSQIAMAARGEHRTMLETHLEETRSHATRVRERLAVLDGPDDGSLLRAGLGLVQGVSGQVLALARTPIDLVRAPGDDARVLANAKDACAAEAREIATYAALERIARDADDEETAELAAAIRADEEAMLQRLLDGLEPLTDAVAQRRADGGAGGGAGGAGSAGAATATREAAARAKRQIDDAGSRARRGAHAASRRTRRRGATAAD